MADVTATTTDPGSSGHRHMHLHGPDADHVEWMAGPIDDRFDAVALEEAMIEARNEAYRALASIDAA